MVTSLTSGGALVGAVAAGLTADHFGRRWPIWGACLTFVIGTTLQTCAFSVGQFAAGRFIVGLGVGSASMIVPMYSESLVVCLGQFAVLIGYSWRDSASTVSWADGGIQQYECHIWTTSCKRSGGWTCPC